MEKVGEFFKNIIDRFSNPLIFSFIVSWMVINWQITVGLLWYDDKLLQNTGCNTIFEFIKDNINKQDSFWNPFWIALIFTFILPIVKNVILAFNTWIAKWGDSWSLSISKDSKIRVEKYLKLREEYQNRSKILEDVIAQESTTVEKYNKLNTELQEERTNFNKLKQSDIEKDNKISEISAERQELQFKLINLEKSLLNISSTLIHDFEGVFGDFQWELQILKGNQSVHSELFYFLPPNTFVVGAQNIILTDIKVDLRNRVILFKKSNPQKGYKDVQTILVMVEDNYFEGIEGYNRVEYRRILSPNSDISEDGMSVLHSVFGTNRWEMSLNSETKYKEYFRYRGGRFLVEQNEVIGKNEYLEITDVKFNNNELSFYKHNKKRKYAKRLVVIKMVSKDYWIGDENGIPTEYKRTQEY